MKFYSITMSNAPESIKTWYGEIRRKFVPNRVVTYHVIDGNSNCIIVAKAFNNDARYKIEITSLSEINNELIVKYRITEKPSSPTSFTTQVAGYLYSIVRTYELCTLPIVFKEA